MTFSKKYLGWIILPVLLFMTNQVLADSDNDEARRLRESGDVLPLETILQKLHASHPGKILDVDLENENGKVIYEITILDNKSKVREFKVDAKTGELLHNRGDD